jgi:hypothetical protein
MLLKIAITLLFVGYASAVCCQEYNKKLATLAKAAAQGSGDVNEMCCVLNEQVTCIKKNKDCNAEQLLASAETQIKTICSTYTYEVGCLNPKQKTNNKTKPDARDGSGADSNRTSWLTLMTSLWILNRLHH